MKFYSAYTQAVVVRLELIKRLFCTVASSKTYVVVVHLANLNNSINEHFNIQVGGLGLRRCVHHELSRQTTVFAGECS